MGRGFYTIGSAGHEGNAFVAAALRPNDPALLHYRSGGFYLARAQQIAGHDGVSDILKGLLAAADEPIAGGRHKVFGNRRPRRDPPDVDDRVAAAAGARRRLRHRRRGRARRGHAVAARRPRRVQLRRRLREPLDGPRDDQRRRPDGLPRSALPLLLVCEDNGLGISVPTPAGWVAARCRTGREFRTCSSTDRIRSPCTKPPRSWLSWSATSSAPQSSTSGSCAMGAMPAPTSNRRTGTPAASAPIVTPTRSSPRHGCSSPPGWQLRRSWCAASSTLVPSCGRRPPT